MAKEQTCEQRIAKHLESRLQSFRPILKALSGDTLTVEELGEVTNLREPNPDDYDEEQLREMAQERQNELPLSVEKLTIVKVLLSTGGPADWFEAHCDSDGTITRIEYVFQDWFRWSAANTPG